MAPFWPAVWTLLKIVLIVAPLMLSVAYLTYFERNRGAKDLYEPERDAHYYEQMPPASAFPRSGGRTGIHDELIRRLAGSGWPSWLLLNYGTLPPEVIARTAAPLREWRILNPVPGISLMLGRG